jgi:small subunit ribosomal protein S6
MALYETIFIIRQDVSSADVDKITEEFSALLEKNGAKILKTEYWGLRNLAYDINNNKKGHYVLFGLDSKAEPIAELERKMKYSEDIIRCLTLKVDSITQEPSAILRGKVEGFDDTIDVTIG